MHSLIHSIGVGSARLAIMVSPLCEHTELSLPILYEYALFYSPLSPPISTISSGTHVP